MKNINSTNLDKTKTRTATDRAGSKTKKPPVGGGTGLLPGLLLVLIWLGLSGYGFYYAHNYFEQSLKRIAETNALNLQSLEDRLNALEEQMQNINQTLDQTGSSLDSTTTASIEVNKRINQLDEQLKALEKSLKILQESDDEVN